jgi:hypothetical protein
MCALRPPAIQTKVPKHLILHGFDFSCEDSCVIPSRGIRLAKALGMETTMADRNYKPWNTPDFELKFREAMGREMTRQEREFFGLMDDDSNRDEEAGPSSAPASNRAEFSWNTLRRVSPLVG